MISTDEIEIYADQVADLIRIADFIRSPVAAVRKIAPGLDYNDALSILARAREIAEAVET